MTGKPIPPWCQPGQTCNGGFGDIATTIDERRCELVGCFLLDDYDLLDLFGYKNDSNLRPDNSTYLSYIGLCVLALMTLGDYTPEGGKWGQTHSCANRATVRCLWHDGHGRVQVFRKPEQADLQVRVDRNLAVTHGSQVLEKMLLHLHMYRVTTDIGS